MADIWDFFASCAKLQIVFFFFFFFFLLPETLPKKKNTIWSFAQEAKNPKYLLEFRVRYQKKKNPIKAHQKIIIHKNKRNVRYQKLKKNPNNRKSKNLY